MTYRRITRAHYDPARYDEVRALASEIYVAVCDLPGFRGMYEGTDRLNGTTAVVTVWDTEHQAQFSRDALGDVIPRLHALGVQVDPPEIFEITPKRDPG